MAFIKRNGFVVVATVLLLIMGTALGVVAGSHRATLIEQRETISALGEDLTRTSVGNKVERKRVAADQSGADNVRLDADREVIGALLGKSLTWKSNAEYIAARESVMRTYKLSPKSQFMATFLPRPPITKDSSGNEYPYIDAAKLNSSVGMFQPKVLSVQGTEYRYVVLTRVNSSSASGKATATRVATIYLTVDGNEKITDLTGYAAAKAVRDSGEGR